MTSELASFAAQLRERISLPERRSPIRRDLISKQAAGSETGAPLQNPKPFSDAGFNTLALELFALQFAANPAYRRICEARGASPVSVEHWMRIPAVPTAAFKELELTCLAPEERTTVFHSSGTTGQRPSRHFHCAESLELYEASLWPWFQRNVLGAVGQAFQPAGSPDFPVRCLEQATGKSPAPADRNVCPTSVCGLQLAILTPPPTAAPNSSLVHMFQTVRRNVEACSRRGDEADSPDQPESSASSRRRLQDSAFLGIVDANAAWALDFTLVENGLRSAVASNTPLLILGTAFNFVQLLDWLAERDLRFVLPPGSVVMETGGYKGRSRELPKPELHQLITRRLGVLPSQIVCEYGMSELSSQAYDCMAGPSRLTHEPRKLSGHASRTFHFPPWVRVQIISPETGNEVAEGETGLIRVFDLANAFSVLAVQTEDLAVRRGDGFELIGRAVASEPRGCSLMTIDARKS
jgi:hypothetical protein